MNTPPPTPAEAKSESLAMFADQGPGHINCAQTVLRFALLITGNDADHIAIAKQFGGGLAGTGETCGAVTGAALALGLLDHLRGDSADPAASRAALQSLLSGFTEEFGGLRCRKLTGFDFTTPEGHDAFVASGGMRLCTSFVDWMCDQLTPLVAPGS